VLGGAARPKYVEMVTSGKPASAMVGTPG
jgi:hypothetical protein